jgi:NTP pyrophosphatase (non-canonical NTP hydrolase)
MNKNEEILTILQEECAEVIQAVSKIRRFGVEENIDQLKLELGDLICMIDLVFEFKVVDVSETEIKNRILEKRNKLKQYSKIFEVSNS